MRFQHRIIISIVGLAGWGALSFAQAPGQPFQEAFKLEETPPAAGAPASSSVDRDPFWPIGYAPQAIVEAPRAAPAAVTNVAPAVTTPIEDLTPEKMKALKSKINVGGIMKQGTRYYVLVNNQMVTVGDTIQIPFEGNVYRFIVRTLNDQDVTLEPLENKPSSNAQKTGDH